MKVPGRNKNRPGTVVFRMDSVGKQAGGCNPMPISYETADDRIVIDTDELDSYAGAFAAWSGPTQ